VTKHLSDELQYVRNVKCETVESNTKKCEFDIHPILSKYIRKLELLSSVLDL